MSKDRTEVKEGTFSKTALMNKRAILCYVIVCAVLFFAYMLELVKGNRTVGYIIIFMVILLAPLIFSIIYYRANRSGKLVKRAITVGFGALYAYVLLTSTSVLSFVYAVPMFIAITVFSDATYTLRVGVGATIINMVFIVMSIMSGANSAENIVNYEIQMAALILMNLFSYFSSKTLRTISDYEIGLVEKEQKKQNEMLEKIVTATTGMCTMIENIDMESKTMASQGKESRVAINEIVSGTNELAGTIQNQLRMTENISQLTDATVQLVSEIQDKFSDTKKNTLHGAENMKALGEASVISKEACATVHETMGSLSEKIEKMNSILGLIKSVTRQTTLLSLNASIEAAQAGENGKGFAVVAEEIKKLAEETAVATSKIGAIFVELEEQTEVVEQSISSLIDANKQQEVLMKETASTFKTIQYDIDWANNSIGTQAEHVNMVSNSNGEINEAIGNLSAFSEELFANAENTKELTEKTITGTEAISDLLDRVMIDVQSLQTFVH